MSKNIDQVEIKKLLKGLEKFGLNEKEAQVYFALLPRRDTGSSKLVQATGLHKQFVYNALERLEELGLAKHVLQNGRKRFTANPPQRLLALADEQKLAAQSMATALQPWFTGAHEQDFEVYQGENAFIAHQLDLLRRAPQGGTLDAIATETERFQKTFEAYSMWDEYLKLQKEKGIKIRYLGSEAQRERLQKREQNEPLWTYRTLPGQATGNISIDVQAEMVTFMTYGEPMLCFTITNKEVADGYRQFFNTLWELGKK